MSEVGDLGTRDGVVEIMHIRIVILTCQKCGTKRRTDNADQAERFINTHNGRCIP